MKYLVFNDEGSQNRNNNNVYLHDFKISPDQNAPTTFHEYDPHKYPPNVEFAKNHGVKSFKYL